MNQYTGTRKVGSAADEIRHFIGQEISTYMEQDTFVNRVRRVSQSIQRGAHDIVHRSANKDTNGRDQESERHDNILPTFDYIDFSNFPFQLKLFYIGKVSPHSTKLLARLCRVFVRDTTEEDDLVLLEHYVSRWTNNESQEVLLAIGEKEMRKHEEHDLQRALEDIMGKIGMDKEKAKRDAPDAHNWVWKYVMP